MATYSTRTRRWTRAEYDRLIKHTTWLQAIAGRLRLILARRYSSGAEFASGPVLNTILPESSSLSYPSALFSGIGNCRTLTRCFGTALVRVIQRRDHQRRLVPPRWIPDLNGGYGYPLFVFYQPGYFYVSRLFSFVRHAHSPMRAH